MFLHRAAGAVLLAGLAPSIGAAQTEAALKRAFEGKRVTVKIEMPATKWGIDLTPGNDPPIDFRAYSHRVKEYGIALRPGDSALVTGVKVKDSLIEFQLAGGGYGTLFDDTSESVYVAPAQKTAREKNLKKALEREADPAARKKIKEELGDLREERHRHDQLAEAVAAQASETRRMQIRQKALEGGSRFNLRYPKGYWKDHAPTPEMVMGALREYLDFPEDPRR